MNILDRSMQPGSTFHIVLGAILIAFFTVLAFVEPQHRYISMFLVIIGVSALARDIKLHNGMDEL